MRRVAGPLLERAEIPVEPVLGLGLGVDGDPQHFDMTAFSLRLSNGANAVSLLRAALRAEHGAEASEGLSVDYAALDIQQVHLGMMIALPAPQWERFRGLGASELAAVLREMARAIDPDRYRKSVRGPKKPVARKVYRNGGHVSTHKLLKRRTQ